MSKGIQVWVDRLSKIEMPILSAVMQQLNRLTGDDDAEVNQLAEVILKDPHLTSQILRIANSIQYNPANNHISTVSRAIVLLGFRGVRSLCISLMLVDALLGKEPRARLLSAMAKSFHAAVQAKAIYKTISDKNHEEVFIAALLYDLGEMAFWAYGGQSADRLEGELHECIDADHKVIEKELGTSFRSLTRELGKVWGLGETLQEAISTNSKVSPLAESVRLGEQISQLAPSDREGRTRLARKVAALTGSSMSDSANLINKASESAAAVALEYGAADVCHLLPRKKDLESSDQKINQVLQPDPNLQLKILRDLANSVAEKVDVNTVFQMALEGMHRGIGLERVALTFFRQNTIQPKYVLGQCTEGWRQNFKFDISEGAGNLFADCIKRPQPVWIDKPFIERNSHLFTGEVKDLLGNHEAFIGVLRINRRNAALFYADRGYTREQLSQDQFEAFRHFLSQSELSIQAMANDR